MMLTKTLTDLMWQVQSAFRKNKPTVSVVIDGNGKNIVFCSQVGNGVAEETYPHKSRAFMDDFYAELTSALREYVKKHPSSEECDFLFTVPDRAVAVDMIYVPTLRKKKIENSADVLIDSLYRKREELVINTQLATQNKQQTMFSTYAIRGDIANGIKGVCETVKVAFAGITFASACTVAAVGHLHSKMRGSSYLLLDIRENESRYVFVAKGRASGFYKLPFGYSALHKSKVSAEDLLIDHSVAELAVLNAKEKAKAKQLTMMREDMTEELNEAGAEESDGADEIDFTPPVNTDGQAFKVLPKKSARKLPKFMLRPTPETEEGFLAENFRLFVKWTLNLISENNKLCLQGKPEAVYVRMPEQFGAVLDTVNNEKQENGIEFKLLEARSADENKENYLENFGGLNPSNISKSCIFRC